MHRRRLIAGALAAAVVLLVAGPASAATFRGTVVHKNRSAHKFVLATSSGRLVVLRSTRATRVGSVVRVSAARLASGAWSARSIRSAGSRRHARLRGTVTFASRSRRVFTISTRGASILVHQRRLRGRTARAASDTMPAAGEQVAVQTTIDGNDDLEADDVQNEGQDDNGMEIEGKVLSVDQAKRQLSVAADDDDASGAAVTVDVPDSFDLSQFQVGNEVELKVVKQQDGTFLLTKADGDDEDKGDGNDGSDGDHHSGDPGGQQQAGDGGDGSRD